MVRGHVAISFLNRSVNRRVAVLTDNIEQGMSNDEVRKN
jgi:hypothetical protein